MSIKIILFLIAIEVVRSNIFLQSENPFPSSATRQSA